MLSIILKSMELQDEENTTISKTKDMMIWNAKPELQDQLWRVTAWKPDNNPSLMEATKRSMQK